jgi:hypothetical protein
LIRQSYRAIDSQTGRSSPFVAKKNGGHRFQSRSEKRIGTQATVSQRHRIIMGYKRQEERRNSGPFLEPHRISITYRHIVHSQIEKY